MAPEMLCPTCFAYYRMAKDLESARLQIRELESKIMEIGSVADELFDALPAGVVGPELIVAWKTVLWAAKARWGDALKQKDGSNP